MTSLSHTRFAVRPVAAAVAAALLGPMAAIAEPLFQVPLYRDADMTRYTTNYIEAGVGWAKEDAWRYGNYTGIHERGAFPLLNFNLGSRAGDGLQWNVSGFDLGTDSRQAQASVGSQGLWGLRASFGEVTNHITNTGRFIHTGLGGSVLELPAGFAGISAGASQPPANIAAIQPFLRPFDVKTERDFMSLGGSFNFARHWAVSVNYRNDTREGTKLTGAVMGNSGGTPRSVVVPYPIDDTTQEVEGAIDYVGQALQFRVAYLYSKYENDHSSLTWRNPYAQITGWAPGTGFPTGYGRMGLMPSNEFNQLRATMGYSLSPTTRLNAVFSYGRAEQNETFLPYTINNLLVPNGLPSSSLDGRIDSTLFDVSLSTKVFNTVGLKASYQYLHNDNKTPSRTWLYVGGDTTNQDVIPVGGTPAQIASPRVRTNIAPGLEENKFKLDADYSLTRGTKVRGYYQYLKLDYEPAAAEFRADTDTHTVGAEVRSRMSNRFTGSLKYQFDQRRGSDWDPNRPYRASYSPAQVAVVPSDNAATLRQYYMADYDQNTVKAALSFAPADAVAMQVSGKWYSRDYKGPDCGQPADQVVPNQVMVPQCLGRTNAVGQDFTIDTQWSLSETMSLFAFYTFTQFTTDQASRSWGGANLQTNTNRNWWADLDSTDHTLGIGANYKPAARPWDFGWQYILNRGNSGTALRAAPGLLPPVAAFLPVPDVDNRLQQVQLYGGWQMNRRIKLRANAVYQAFRSNDWYYNNASPWESQTVLLTGQDPGSYHNVIVGISAAITLW